jgi:hypothetical protein
MKESMLEDIKLFIFSTNEQKKLSFFGNNLVSGKRNYV